MKITWTGIRTWIAMKQSRFIVLSYNNESVTDSKQIADVFDDNFTTVSKKAKAKILVPGSF